MYRKTGPKKGASCNKSALEMCLVLFPELKQFKTHEFNILDYPCFPKSVGNLFWNIVESMTIVKGYHRQDKEDREIGHLRKRRMIMTKSRR